VLTALGGGGKDLREGRATTLSRGVEVVRRFDYIRV